LFPLWTWNNQSHIHRGVTGRIVRSHKGVSWEISKHFKTKAHPKSDTNMKYSARQTIETKFLSRYIRETSAVNTWTYRYWWRSLINVLCTIIGNVKASVSITSERIYCSSEFEKTQIIVQYRFRFSRPSLWSSGQTSWLRSRGPKVDFLSYHMFYVAVVLERGPLSLGRKAEKVQRLSSVGICCADHIPVSTLKPRH
jgi:hypothetical protein